jgi:glutathione S-transferase
MFLAAKADEAIDGLTDATNLVTSTMGVRDPQRKVAMRQDLVAPDGRLTMLLNGLETVLKQGNTWYVAGSSLSVADLAVWRFVGWISSGVLDGIPRNYVESCFPLTWAVHCTVDKMPKVAEWKAMNPHHYRVREEAKRRGA